MSYVRMYSDDIMGLLLVVAGVLVLLVVRKSSLYERHRDDGLTEQIHGSIGQRMGARYFRDLEWQEAVLYLAAPFIFIGILYLWSWWQGW